MTKDISEIRERLKTLLLAHHTVLKVKVDKETNFEVSGTIEATQGKQMVDGVYFSSLVPKAKDIRFYFYPAYTHPTQFEDISPELAKLKKGKSCFHIKYLDDELETELTELIAKAIAVYQKEGWLAA